MLYQDGAFGIHTRSLKYGKLVNGELLTVQPSLVRRSKSHFYVFPWGVEVILGLNGYVWVGLPRCAPGEQGPDTTHSPTPQEVSPAHRMHIARTRNSIKALDRLFLSIDAESITHAFDTFKSHDLQDMLNEAVMGLLLQ